MKKMITICFLILLMMSFSTVDAKDYVLTFDNLSTENYSKIVGEIDFQNIKKICSYDFCQYRKGDNMKETINSFTKSYLENIEDEEVRAIINVKGLRITKIVLF